MQSTRKKEESVAERKIRLLKYPGLNIDARVVGSLVKGVEARGIFKHMMRPTIELMEEYVVREKPAVMGEDFVILSLFFPPIPSPEFSRALRNQIKIKLTGRLIPEIMSISVTDRCGIDCWLCGHWGRELSPEMTTDELKSLIDTATSMGCFNVIWTGGDPLLREDIEELTRYTKERGAINTMFTPGIHLKKRARGLAKAGLFSVYPHIHSWDAAEHDRLVGKAGAHEKVIEGVKECMSEGIYVGAETYMTHERLRDGTLERIIEYAESLGCPEILLSDPLPTGKVLRREDIILTQEDRDILVRTQKEHNTERSGGIKIFTNSCVKGPQGVGCIAGNKWVHVTAIGEVCACDYTPFSFGNIRNEPFKKIWRRINKNPTYSTHTDLCRIQDPEFRRRYVDMIPEGAVMPYPFEKLEEMKDKPKR